MPNLKRGPTTQVIWRSIGNPGIHAGELLAVLRDNTGTKWSLTINAPTPETWARLRTITEYKRKSLCWNNGRISPRWTEHLLCTLWKELSSWGGIKGPGPCPLLISRANGLIQARDLDRLAFLAELSWCVQISWRMSSQTFSTCHCSSL